MKKGSGDWKVFSRFWWVFGNSGGEMIGVV